MEFCIYGCGQEATHQFKNGKWCCSKYMTQCPYFIEKTRQKNTGKKRSMKFRRNISKKMQGQRNPMFGTKGYWFGKKRSENDIKKFKISHRITIEKIKEKYPFFSQIEEMRYNPDKPEEKEIQVHCKNHTCPNSKEQDGWFTPTKTQLYERIRHLEKDDGNDGAYLYCLDSCKKICPLYAVNHYSFVENIKQYTQEEYQTFRQFVLTRDNHSCQFCGKQAEQVHHERPQKLEPFFSLDPEYAWSCCKECHNKFGHPKDTKCSTGNLANKNCI